MLKNTSVGTSSVWDHAAGNNSITNSQWTDDRVPWTIPWLSQQYQLSRRWRTSVMSASPTVFWSPTAVSAIGKYRCTMQPSKLMFQPYLRMLHQGWRPAKRDPFLPILSNDMITNGNGAPARCASRTIQVWLTVLASKLAKKMPAHKLLWSAACYVLSQHTAVSETTLVRYGNGDFIAPAYASDAWQ